MTLTQLTQLVKDTVANTLGGELDLARLTVGLTADAKFGDFATNAAMVYAKDLKRSPREVAEEVAKALEGSDPAIKRAEVAGPGFINITLSSEAIAAAAEAAATTRPQNHAGEKVVLEYSDPNPFKPLHAGHLYTTLVGDVISRLYELSGANVVRLTYGGDVGLHVGRSMWGIIKALGGEHPDKMDEIPEAERPKWLGARYAEGYAASEEDPEAKQEITAFNKRVYEVHAEGDKTSAFARIYWTGRKWSYDYFPKLYEQLQVTPFDRTIPESEVTTLGLATVREQLKAGVYETSDGAVVFKGEPFGLHTRVFINSQGLPTYEAKDVGLLLTKWQDYNFDRSIVITAVEQAEYFAVMLKSVEQFAPDPAQRSRHLTHGTVKLAGGMKMSSRKGNVVGALDILEAAMVAAKATPAGGSTETVLAAVKYAFIKNRLGGDINYDPKESVSLEGNSGPYLQYAHARARSIIAKSGKEAGSDGGSERLEKLGELDAAERSLAARLGEYADVLQRAVDEMRPHHIATYLYELAQNFNRFYEANRVVGGDREKLRLRLVGIYADILRSGLNTLGITAPDRL